MFEIRNLSLQFKSKIILNNLNLEVNQGNIFGILGKNGAGKTTFFETIFQNTKYTGQILWDHQKLEKRNISYLESENYFYPYLSVKDILDLFINEKNKKNVKKLAAFLNIPDNTVIEKLSLGTKKKLAILCNISIDRPIYLLDEPFNGLDFESVEKMYFLLQELKANKKIVFISSHVLETLTLCCDTIGHLQNGTFHTFYKPEEFSLIRSQLTEEIKQDWMTYTNF
ncbi:ATP-binding cassette domain-containing protein [Chryseobacterium sp. JUb7]|uniref:ABC transporter ATP-binding protein n=1 Tax=Chryseobacterium sp. JUb7 TaxID=2940599 RepID=UPI002168A976|nr:ATP-binding cassette domain-containing protein [Chryseobacterium sp. JUb7]MCS3530808.1 ABC-2 type transport system ATP-binding protein [Chryseobacterium sp. JUb7]